MTRSLARVARLLGPFVGLALVVAIFGALEPEAFLSVTNARTVLVQSVALAIGAIGMTYVIVSGGIDLSVGSTMALASVVVARTLNLGWSPLAAAGAGAAAGLAVGVTNGVVITALRINPFIATLGSLGIARGFAKWLASNQKIDADPGWLASLTAKIPTPEWLLVAPSVWVAVIAAVVAALVLRNTVFGIHVQAIGSNEATARLCGVRVARTKICVYAISGLCAGVAGTLLFARLLVGDPTGALGMELQVVAATVIGGASLAGGEGTILGSVVGALLLGFLAAGCNLVDMPNAIQEILTGVIIVAAVAIDAWRQRRLLR